jgi:hypothetical protein
MRLNRIVAKRIRIIGTSPTTSHATNQKLKKNVTDDESNSTTRRSAERNVSLEELTYEVIVENPRLEWFAQKEEFMSQSPSLATKRNVSSSRSTTSVLVPMLGLSIFTGNTFPRGLRRRRRLSWTCPTFQEYVQKNTTTTVDGHMMHLEGVALQAP